MFPKQFFAVFLRSGTTKKAVLGAGSINRWQYKSVPAEDPHHIAEFINEFSRRQDRILIQPAKDR